MGELHEGGIEAGKANSGLTVGPWPRGKKREAHGLGMKSSQWGRNNMWKKWGEVRIRVSMVCGMLLAVGGSDHNLIKLGFEETVQQDMNSLEGGEDEL